MTVRRARRVSLALAGGYLLLCARPLAYLLLLPGFKRLPAEMRDGKAANAAILKAIRDTRLSDATQTYQVQLEVSRRAFEVALDDEMLVQLDEDLAKAKAAMETAWLEAHAAA